MGYPKEEQETVLVFDAQEKRWQVYSNVPKHVRKLNKIMDFKVLSKEIKNDTPIKIEGYLKEKQVSMKKLRVLTEEQKQKQVNALFKARNVQEKQEN